MSVQSCLPLISDTTDKDQMMDEVCDVSQEDAGGLNVIAKVCR